MISILLLTRHTTLIDILIENGLNWSFYVACKIKFFCVWTVKPYYWPVIMCLIQIIIHINSFLTIMGLGSNKKLLILPINIENATCQHLLLLLHESSLNDPLPPNEFHGSSCSFSFNFDIIVIIYSELCISSVKINNKLKVTHEILGIKIL